MRAIRRILVAVKALQASSLPAVLKAGQLARAYGAQLELFHSLDTPLYIDPYLGDQGPRELQQQLRQQALHSLETIADRLRQHSISVTVSAEWDFPAYEAILRRALRSRADLIVASQHGGRHRAPWLLRLTDWELIRFSPVPVLLVKNPHPYRHPRVLAAVDPTHSFAKPLQLDRKILHWAGALSHGLRGTLHAVHAFPRMPVGSLTPQAMAVLTPMTIEKLERRTERSAKISFDRLLRTTRTARSRRYLQAGSPRDVIADAARSSRSSIVVMGAISRSGLKRVFIGNTAEQILDDLSCDILVVKPTKFANRVPRNSRGPRVMVAPTGYYN